MKKLEALRVLTKVKAIWPRQPIDGDVFDEWFEALASVEYADAVEVVRGYRDLPAEQPPTVGMIKDDALGIAQRRESKREAESREREWRKQVAEDRPKGHRDQS